MSMNRAKVIMPLFIQLYRGYKELIDALRNLQILMKYLEDPWADLQSEKCTPNKPYIYCSARISGLFYTEKVIVEHKKNYDAFQVKQ